MKQPSPSRLLTEYWLAAGQNNGPVLDLACGSGRNGLWLARQGVPVHFIDRNNQALDGISDALNNESLPGHTQIRDLETVPVPDLGREVYRAVLVFRYLHRPLIPMIKKALQPGGVLFYETFLTDQAAFGKPSNPDFLLKHGELSRLFEGWEALCQGESIDQVNRQAVSWWVGRKPEV